jgi:hypothetical protein
MNSNALCRKVYLPGWFVLNLIPKLSDCRTFEVALHFSGWGVNQALNKGLPMNPVIESYLKTGKLPVDHLSRGNMTSSVQIIQGSASLRAGERTCKTSIRHTLRI